MRIAFVTTMVVLTAWTFVEHLYYFRSIRYKAKRVRQRGSHRIQRRLHADM